MTPPGRQTVWWLMTILLAVIATTLLLRWDDASLVRSAQAQLPGAGNVPLAGARGIYAFTGQLTSKSYGLFMVDVDSGTIWCYEMQHGANNEPQMKLVAARSWIFDRYLEEFNVADPIPSAVKALVQQQRVNAAAANAVVPPNAANPPVLPQNPKPK